MRETPETQRLEEELVQVKLREAEAQLAIKELQKTIHVLNLEYQEFLNNRNAVIVSSLNGPMLNPAAAQANNPSLPNSNSNNNLQAINSSNFQLLEEELLKVKMREAEVQSELKSLNLKLMQLETEVKYIIFSFLLFNVYSIV